MLVLTRKPGEKIMIGDDIVITFLESRAGDGIRIGIDAPRHLEIKREEIFGAVAEANLEASKASVEDVLGGLSLGAPSGVSEGDPGGETQTPVG